MARRFSGYKTIEKRKIQTDAGVFELRIYIGKDYGEGATKFKAVCFEFNVNETEKDLDTAVEAAIKKIKEHAVVDWKPFLYVKVHGDSDLRSRDEDDDKPEPFITDDQSGHPNSMNITISVERIELSDANGKQQQRRQEYGGKRIRDGWPDIGYEEKDTGYYGWRKNSRDMRALVTDTPENRAAFDALRNGMRQMLRKLEDILSPDNIEEALTSAVPKLLPAPPPKKKAKKKANKRVGKKRSRRKR